MSVEALGAAWAIRLAPTEKLVLLGLADHADPEGRCWPSVDRLAEFTCCSRRTVQNVLKGLVASGVLVVEQEAGRYRPNTYRLVLPGLDPSRPQVPTSGKGKVTTKLRRHIIERDQQRCYWCRRDGDDRLDPDGHIWNMDRYDPAGRYEETNVVLACRRCNVSRRGTNPPAWIMGVEAAPMSEPGVQPVHAMGAAAAPEPPVQPPAVGLVANAPAPTGPAEADHWVGLQHLVPSTFGQGKGRTVTAGQRELAARILSYWERRTGVEAGRGAASGVVGRVREHPSLDAEEHRALIDANLRRPWWEGAATAQVLYGNPKAFEAALARWRHPGRRGAREPASEQLNVEAMRAKARRVLDSANQPEGDQQ